MVSSGGVHNNLPLSLTSFVGRGAELDEVRGMVRPGGLLTTTGAGGSGKTRLALEAARLIANGFDEGSGHVFPDGVWLVELDALRDPSLVAREVASVMGIGERPGRDLSRELPVALRERRCMVVLDNCEHLIEACADLTEGLLRRCPDLAVLATSREPLGTSGERVWQIPALSIPEAPTMDAAIRCESARLFEERAASVWHGFALSEENAPAVVEICHRLEGVPLALELAASRVRSMTPAQISARLDDALALLAPAPRTAPQRQSTLRAAIDWSHDLLPHEERAVFRTISVFSGGFTLEAAEEVCRDEAEQSGDSVLNILSRLVDKSLVEARREGESARYRIQEVIRQYASEKLEEAGKRDDVRRRHAVYFLDYAEVAESELPGGPDMGLWLDLVDGDLDNFRAALSWAAEFREGEIGLRISNALAWFWLRRGRLSEGRAAAERALAVGAGSRLDVAKAVHVSGGLAWAQGDREAAGPRLNEAMKRFEELDADDSFHWEFFDGWFSSGYSIHSLERLALGEIEAAVTLAEKSIAIARRFEEGNEMAIGTAALGVARMAAGDLEEAVPPLEKSASISRKSGDGWLLSFPVGNLAVISLLTGDFEKAQSLAKESVGALRGLDEKWFLSMSLAYLALTLAARGHERRATVLFGASEAMREEVGQEEVYAHYRTIHDRGVSAARESVGEEEFAAAWAVGRAMDVEEAISFALEEGEYSEPRTPELRIFALGESRVEVGGEVVEAADWKYAKVKEIFFYLVSNSPASRERIGVELWPDASRSGLRNALGNTMFRIRNVLDRRDRVIHHNGEYAFDHAIPHTFDVRDFEEKIHHARRCAEDDPEAAATLLEEAAELYRGDFLEGFPGGEWIFYRQQELREEYIESQTLLGDLRSDIGEHIEAVRAYRRAISHDPYSAKAHAGLIRAYSRHHEPGLALRHYQAVESTFHKDLDATPPPELATLAEKVRNGEEI